METRKRSIVKALSWRLIATAITTSLALFLTGELVFAAKIGLLDTSVKFFSYFLHERAWLRISYGRHQPPDYQI